MTKPLLTIAIPTYNRDVWLDKSLSIIEKELIGVQEKIELIISNNASTDSTEELIKKYKVKIPFHYNRNEKNIGAIRNINLIVNLATANLVWVLGDDDFLADGFLKKLIELIENKKNIYFYYIPMKVWYPNKIFTLGDEIDYKAYVEPNFFNQDFKYSEYSTLKEIATMDKGYFNAISNFIMSKEYYVEAFKIGIEAGEEFTSIETTFPHSYYIAKNLLNISCIEITTPSLICSHAISWKKYYEITWLKWFPELVILMQKNGADKKESLEARRQIIHRNIEMLPKLLKGNINNYVYFSWITYFKDNIFILEFWKMSTKLLVMRIKG